MKKIKLLTLLFPLLVTSCATSIISSNSSSSNSISQNTSSSTQSEEEVNKDAINLDFYNLNDFHGHLKAIDNRHPGISAVSGFLNKQKEKNPNGYVFTNSGDMWQETYEAYTTKGTAISACLKAMNCEAFGVGNHEFDWGTDVILENREVLGDALPILGANVYHYDEVKKEVTTQANDIFDPYKIIERQGVKIGLVGVIGYDQITSITSSAWEGLTFLEPVQVLLDYSKELKNEKDCDIVIALCHFPYTSLSTNDIKSLTLKYDGVHRYIDTLFLGHSHKNESFFNNGVPFLQAHCYGDQVSHVTLSFDKKTDNVVCTKHELLHVPYNAGYSDPKIEQIMDSYFDENYYNDANKIVGQFKNCSGTINKKESGNFLAYATYQLLKDDYPNLLLVGNNGGRSPINVDAQGNVSREKIYRTNPFTNQTIIAHVKGNDILYQYKSGRYSDRNSYYMPEDIAINRDEYYQVAIIDYVMLHKNTQREYDRIPSYTTSDGVLKTYSCEILSNYLSEVGFIDYQFLANGMEFKCLKENLQA